VIRSSQGYAGAVRGRWPSSVPCHQGRRHPQAVATRSRANAGVSALTAGQSARSPQARSRWPAQHPHQPAVARVLCVDSQWPRARRNRGLPL